MAPVDSQSRSDGGVDAAGGAFGASRRRRVRREWAALAGQALLEIGLTADIFEFSTKTISRHFGFFIVRFRDFLSCDQHFSCDSERPPPRLFVDRTCIRVRPRRVALGGP
jgi:hypothetical protein